MLRNVLRASGSVTLASGTLQIGLLLLLLLLDNSLSLIHHLSSDLVTIIHRHHGSYHVSILYCFFCEMSKLFVESCNFYRAHPTCIWCLVGVTTLQCFQDQQTALLGYLSCSIGYVTIHLTVMTKLQQMLSQMERQTITAHNALI